MNLQEFAALKVGDVIRNDMAGSTGTVAAITDAGVKVHWGTGPLFTYTAHSTAYFHWSKDDEPQEATAQGEHDAAVRDAQRPQSHGEGGAT